MTSIYPDGKISVRTLGGVVRNSKLKVLKQGGTVPIHTQIQAAEKRDKNILKKYIETKYFLT
jgi:hypothetical protein